MVIEEKIEKINDILDTINSTGMGLNYSAEMAFTKAPEYEKENVVSIISSSVGQVSPYSIMNSSKKEIYYDLYRTIRYQGIEGDNHPNLKYIKSNSYYDAADDVLNEVSELIDMSKAIYSFEINSYKLDSQNIKIYYPVHWGFLYAVEFESCAYTLIGYATD